MHYLIGVDIGTTNIKALLFDETGTEIAAARSASPFSAVGTDDMVQGDRLWDLCCQLIMQIVSSQKELGNPFICDQIAGLAVTGMGEAGVPMDQVGNCLYPVIAWFDTRTESYPSWWNETFGEDRLFSITNLKNQHIFTVNKLLWLKNNEPEIFSKIHRWNCLPDFIVYRLTGKSAMDYSLATRTMMLDARTKMWSKDILHHAGIPCEILPEPVPSGERVGSVTASAAIQCGLKEGTPVFSGGHDHICGAFAAGVVNPGTVLDSSGTCEEVLVCTDTIDETSKLSRKGFNAGLHVVPNRYYISGGIPASGASVDWFRREFNTGASDSKLSTAGARGLLFLPHLRGSSSPLRDKVSRGAFIGICDYHQKPDFMQAVYEGVAFELRLCAEQLLGGSRPQRVVSIGGGTMNDYWMQVKADILNSSIEIPAVKESTAFGAALLAGVGAGIFCDVQDALERTYRVGKKLFPRPEANALYDRLFQDYKILYERLYSINADLNSL